MEEREKRKDDEKDMDMKKGPKRPSPSMIQSVSEEWLALAPRCGRMALVWSAQSSSLTIAEGIVG